MVQSLDEFPAEILEWVEGPKGADLRSIEENHGNLDLKPRSDELRPMYFSSTMDHDLKVGGRISECQFRFHSERRTIEAGPTLFADRSEHLERL